MAQNLKSTCYNLTHLTPLGEFAMSETFWIILIICVTVAIVALRGTLRHLIFKATKDGVNAAIDSDTGAKVKISGVVQMKKSKMQVEHDDAEITGIILHDSTLDVKSPTHQPKKSKK